MTLMEGRTISTDRVLDISKIDATDLECAVCQCVLWKPVACQSCETAFCSVCINQWLKKNPRKCPNRCASYTERRCPPSILKLLAQLQLSCSYQEQGCKEIIPYEELEEHEEECGYEPQQCPTCRLEILGKDFDNHTKSCTFVILTCQDCKLVYKRGDAATKHTENICLKEQLRQLRDGAKQDKRLIEKLTRQSNETRTRRTRMNEEVTIKFGDLRSAEEETRRIPNIYRNLEWTEIFYGHEDYLTRNYPRSGYVTSFIPGDSPHVAYFYREASINAEDPDDTFTLVSLTVCAAWNDNLKLKMTGYRNSRAMNTHTAKLLFGKPQMILLQWKDIDKVIFVPSGGTAHSILHGLNRLQVVITQLTVSLA